MYMYVRARVCVLGMIVCRVCVGVYVWCVEGRGVLCVAMAVFVVNYC